MAANQKGKKSGGATPKTKASAPQHAAQRGQRQSGRAAARANRSAKTISRSRYPGETPLTAENRPAARGGGKRGQGSSRKGGPARKQTAR